MILIAGDSWAKGAWTLSDTSVDILQVHGGLGQYILEAGTPVVNLARRGGTNLDTVASIDSFLYPPNGFVDSVEKIFVFQTEWQRDCFRGMTMDEYRRLEFQYETIKQYLIARFYIKLSDVAVKYRVPIFIIGGCSDTIWFEKFKIEHPGLEIVCQSFTNLLINKDHRIDEPVLSSWSPMSVDLVEFAKTKLDRQNLQLLLNDIDLAGLRRSQWQKLYRQDLFGDDRVHPNQHAFRILYEFLLNQNVL